MGTLGSTKTWIPYMTTRDCTQQICSLSCPQLCYVIFTPPPPLQLPDDDSQSSLNISPLVIAIIGILASAFLLVSYYAIISKYCCKSESSRRAENQARNEEIIEEDDQNHQPAEHEPWFISTHGLDEALIKKITLIKYKKDDGLIGSTDCSVCLGEFHEDDSLRLLPKCSHAFHIPCIDTWLKSHSNCPLCRANIISNFEQQIQSPAPPLLGEQIIVNSNDLARAQDHVSISVYLVDQISTSSEGRGSAEKSPFRTLSDLGGPRQREDSHVRRSFSMDHSKERQVSISGVLRYELGAECQVENCGLDDQATKSQAGESSSKSSSSNHSSRSRVLQSVMSSVSLKRSLSSGRFLFGKHGRGSNAISPV